MPDKCIFSQQHSSLRQTPAVAKYQFSPSSPILLRSCIKFSMFTQNIMHPCKTQLCYILITYVFNKLHMCYAFINRKMVVHCTPCFCILSFSLTHLGCLCMSEIYKFFSLIFMAKHFPGGSVVKEDACSAGDMGLIPVLERSPKGGNGNPLQYSCLENIMDRGAWWATVLRFAKSWTRQATEHTRTEWL